MINQLPRVRKAVTSAVKSADQESAAAHIVEEAWLELQKSPFVQQNIGLVPSEMVDLSFGEAERRSRLGKDLLRRANQLDPTALKDDLALSIRVIRYRAFAWSKSAEWYWTAIDPLGIGFFGMFLPTAYCGGYLLSFLLRIPKTFGFEDPTEKDRYLELCSSYARLIDQMTERTLGQASRDIYVPAPQIPRSQQLIDGFRRGTRDIWELSGARREKAKSHGFLKELERRISDEIEPAFDRLSGVFGPHYLKKCGALIGISQYPQGREIYSELIKLHTTLELSAEEVHRAGVERLATIVEQKQRIREQAGYSEDAAFRSSMRNDKRWSAGSVMEIKGLFQKYLGRIEPRLNEYFERDPELPFAVEPLPEALQGSMTFGYYDAPRPQDPRGRYLFNSRNLTQRPLLDLAALIYHELVPGHHLHFAGQLASTELHPLRKNAFINAFNEGWAEYAAALAGEMGLYESAEEQYGRLLMDAFLTTRLVIDTGLNAFGWTMEKARQYLREHTWMTDDEITSEILRYSCDLPGQALAYKLGDTHIFALRQKMRARLGVKFDIRKFHSTVLGAGALPLRDLQWWLEQKTVELMA